mmetsp:Transcript_14290/g.53821  ORF Transcript_14290/g.53821 Transcript_14290/m.53821 type:complete len:274 (-) Transcript_14290:4069-4890(-)
MQRRHHHPRGPAGADGDEDPSAALSCLPLQLPGEALPGHPAHFVAGGLPAPHAPGDRRVPVENGGRRGGPRRSPEGGHGPGHALPVHRQVSHVDAHLPRGRGQRAGSRRRREQRARPEAPLHRPPCDVRALRTNDQRAGGHHLWRLCLFEPRLISQGASTDALVPPPLKNLRTGLVRRGPAEAPRSQVRPGAAGHVGGHRPLQRVWIRRLDRPLADCEEGEGKRAGVASTGPSPPVRGASAARAEACRRARPTYRSRPLGAESCRSRRGRDHS